MLHLITGRAGSGKTSYVRKVLGTLASEGNDRLVLIVPEQYSFSSERAILEQFGEKDAQNIEVLSFTRLADYVFRELGGMSGTLADDGIKIMLMVKALSTVQDQLELYAKHIESIPLAKELLYTVTELRQAAITPAMLREAAQSDRTLHQQSFRQKLRELALIFEAYDAEFSQLYRDNDTLLDRLCQLLKENTFFQGYTVAIDGFKGFTAQELQLLEQLLLQSDDLYLTLCLDQIRRGTEKRNPSLIFESVNETAKKVLQIATTHHISVLLDKPETTGIASGKRYQAEELKLLEEHLFYPEKEVTQTAAKAIHIHSGQDVTEECNFIAASIRKLLRGEELRLRDIAVIVRQEDTYRRELQAAFHRYQIPFFEDSRQPIVNQPLITLTESVFTLLTTGFSTENILRYLKTGLSELSEEQVAKLENYALLWNLSAKAWQEEFTLHPDGLGVKETEKSDATLADLNQMRETIIQPLQALRLAVSKTTAEGIGKAYYDFLTKTQVSQHLKTYAMAYHEKGFTALAAEQSRVWDLLMELLDKLANVMGDRRIPLQTYVNLFHAVVSVTELGNIPQALDQVSIGAADRIRLDSPKVVFVAGCAEGIFPAGVSSNGIFSSADRKQLLEMGLELGLSKELQSCEERFIAYSAVTAASQQVYLTYHRVGGMGESLEPSLIIRSTRELFGAFLEETDAGSLSPDFYAETPASAFSSYALSTQQDSAVASCESVTLRAALETQTDYTGKLYALDRAREKRTFHIQDPNIARALFGTNLKLSASRVDTYYKCAFEYFCKYGLNAKPREPAKLDPAQSGTVIHYVLEQIIKENTIDGLISMTKEQRQAKVDHWLMIYLDENMGGYENKEARFRYLYERLKISLYDVVERLCAEFNVSSFRPVDFELSIGSYKEDEEPSIPAYHLDLKEGGSLEIFGSIDRVDSFEKDGQTYIRVVDYKTGGKDFVLSDVLYGLNMQMLIYLFAIEAGGADYYHSDIIPAGILYYPAKRNTVNLTKKNASEEDIMKAKRTKGNHSDDRGNGLFLLDKNTLDAMEHDLQGNFIPITEKTVNRGKKNEETRLIGNLITAGDMGLLRRKIDQILREMAESLQEGQIDAAPAYNSSRYSNTCKYCDYASVCHYEEGNERQIQNLKNDEVFELLQGKEEDHE